MFTAHIPYDYTASKVFSCVLAQFRAGAKTVFNPFSGRTVPARFFFNPAKKILMRAKTGPARKQFLIRFAQNIF